MCTCAVHCPENPYHESACCHQLDCDCVCHGLFKVEYLDHQGRERFARFKTESQALIFADRNMGLLKTCEE